MTWLTTKAFTVSNFLNHAAGLSSRSHGCWVFIGFHWVLWDLLDCWQPNLCAEPRQWTQGRRRKLIDSEQLRNLWRLERARQFARAVGMSTSPQTVIQSTQSLVGPTSEWALMLIYSSVFSNALQSHIASRSINAYACSLILQPLNSSDFSPSACHYQALPTTPNTSSILMTYLSQTEGHLHVNSLSVLTFVMTEAICQSCAFWDLFETGVELCVLKLPLPGVKG